MTDVANIAKPKLPDRILWVDLETTGLNPTHRFNQNGAEQWVQKDRLLEIACIVTDGALVELARFEAVTNEALNTHFPNVDPFVLDMHVKNGLWAESLLSKKTLTAVELDAMQFIVDNFPREEGQKTPRRILLGGSTVSFDRTFLEVWMPRVAACLGHRHYDVSSVNSFVQRAMPAVWEGRPRADTSGGDTGAKHRAMADIEASLMVARYYVNRLADGGVA